MKVRIAVRVLTVGAAIATLVTVTGAGWKFG